MYTTVDPDIIRLGVETDYDTYWTIYIGIVNELKWFHFLIENLIAKFKAIIPTNYECFKN
jgi:hypothetical protein